MESNQSPGSLDGIAGTVSQEEAELAANIRRLRRAAGLSYDELANAVGYSRQYVSRAEKPERGLASRVLVASIDRALGADGLLVQLHDRAHARRRLRTRRGSEPAELKWPESLASEAARGAHAVVFAEDSQVERDAGVDQTHEVASLFTRAEFLALMAGAAVSSALPSVASGGAGCLDGERNLGEGPWAARTSAAVLHPMDGVRHWVKESTDISGVGDVAPLRPLIDKVMLRSLAAEYVELDRILPEMLGRAEFAALDATGAVDAFTDLADLYTVIGWLLIKADDTLGSWTAAQRAIQAAEYADDPIRVAAATRCLAEVHMRSGNHGKAARTALVAAISLDNLTDGEDGRLATAVRGAALLSAAAASARHGERREAHASLEAASRCAEAMGAECYDLGTAFGPLNVSIHRVAVAIELGDARSAVKFAATLALDRLPPVLAERRARALLDVARGYAALGDFSPAIDTLLAAEQISATEVRTHRITRNLIATLSARDRRNSGVRELARRCGVVL